MTASRRIIDNGHDDASTDKLAGLLTEASSLEVTFRGDDQIRVTAIPDRVGWTVTQWVYGQDTWTAIAEEPSVSGEHVASWVEVFSTLAR